MHLRLSKYRSPLAPLLVVTDIDGVLRALDFADHELRMCRLLRAHYGEYVLEKDAPPASITHALDAYFCGDLGTLNGVPTGTSGTSFQRDVWKALRSIEPGTTRSYGQIAASLGRTNASRAVGAANGANPIAIIVPCHRVIGADGKLTGYGGGLSRKRWLLAHEEKWSTAGYR
jgi:methylated-DNA-[protein]-cysteine S-methyltransferase